MVSINQLAEMAIRISKKKLSVNNIQGDEFIEKYGFRCPTGVRGRNSDNQLFKEKIGWAPNQKLEDGIEKTFKWINSQI